MNSIETTAPFCLVGDIPKTSFKEFPNDVGSDGIFVNKKQVLKIKPVNRL